MCIGQQVLLVFSTSPGPHKLSIFQEKWSAGWNVVIAPHLTAFLSWEDNSVGEENNWRIRQQLQRIATLEYNETKGDKCEY